MCALIRIKLNCLDGANLQNLFQTQRVWLALWTNPLIHEQGRRGPILPAPTPTKTKNAWMWHHTNLPVSLLMILRRTKYCLGKLQKFFSSSMETKLSFWACTSSHLQEKEQSKLGEGKSRVGEPVAPFRCCRAPNS